MYVITSYDKINRDTDYLEVNLSSYIEGGFGYVFTPGDRYSIPSMAPNFYDGVDQIKIPIDSKIVSQSGGVLRLENPLTNKLSSINLRSRYTDKYPGEEVLHFHSILL